MKKWPNWHDFWQHPNTEILKISKARFFLREDGKVNIYDENANKAMDVIDEKFVPFCYKEVAHNPRN